MENKPISWKKLTRGLSRAIKYVDDSFHNWRNLEFVK